LSIQKNVVLNMFFFLKFFFEILFKFSLSFLEMRGFSLSYQILLSLFDILNAFYDNI